MIRLIKYILSIPRNLFTKKSIFSLIIDSKFASKTVVVRGCRIYNSTFGKYSYVGRNSTIIHCKIGNFVSIADNCNIGLAEHDLNNVSTSPVFIGEKNCFNINFNNKKFQTYKDVIIGNDVWIGANVMIKGGIKIGDGAVIGAGSIVTKDIPPYSICAGNPAKLIRYRFDDEKIKKLQELKWWDYNDEELVKLANKKLEDIFDE